jgi:hypothetical protein
MDDGRDGPSTDEPPAHPGLDRRGDARHGIGPRVTVTAPDGTPLRGEADNLSLGGLFVPWPPDPAGVSSAFPPGTDCRVRLTFGGGPRRVVVNLLGRVARADQGGIGVEFTYLDADNHSRLNEALSSGLATASDP